MKSIPIGVYVKKHLKSNPDAKQTEVYTLLQAAVKRQKKGAKCTVCGEPIWALGSAFSGFDGCFTCITGSTEDSLDYEVK